MKDEKAFRALLILDSLRGEHSTGIAAVDKDKEVIVSKTVGDPYQLFDIASCETIFKQANRVLIGHNRFATTGAITRRNAHPFEFDTLVGVHNGTLTRKHELPNSSKFNVDSEALYSYIEEVGVEQAMLKAYGAWALVWYDKNKESINFLRNKERPLYCVYTDSGNTVYWASEAWMLTAALTRYEIKYQKITALPEDFHVEVGIDFKTAGGSLFDETSTEVKGGPDSPVYVPLNTPTFKKKEETLAGGATSSLGIRIDDKYLGSENVYEIKYQTKDEDGASYISLIDTDHLSYSVRYYFHKETHLAGKVGHKFRGKVVGIKQGKYSAYYKVAIISPLFREKELLKLPHKPPTTRDGNVVTKKMHEESYHSCIWCSHPVEYGDVGLQYIDVSTGVVCANCKDDPTIQEYL